MMAYLLWPAVFALIGLSALLPWAHAKEPVSDKAAATERIAGAIKDLVDQIQSHDCLAPNALGGGLLGTVVGKTAKPTIEIVGFVGSDNDTTLRQRREVLSRVAEHLGKHWPRLRVRSDLGRVYHARRETESGPEAAQRLWNELRKSQSDVLLFAETLHRDTAGRLRIALLAVTSAAGCRQTVTIDGLSLQEDSHVTLEGVMRDVAGRLFVEHTMPGRVIIEPTRFQDRLFDAACGRRLELLFAQQLTSESARNHIGQSRITPLLKRDLPVSAMPGQDDWIAHIELFPASNGAELFLRIERMGANSIAARGRVAERDLTCKPRLSVPAVTAAAEKERYFAGRDHIRFHVYLTKPRHLYCMLEATTLGGALVLIPNRKATDVLLAPRQRPFVLPDDFAGLDTIAATEAGRGMLRCFAMKRPAPTEVVKRWVAASVLARAEDAIRHRLPPAKANARLLLPLHEADKLAKALKQRGAEEIRASIEVATHPGTE